MSQKKPVYCSCGLPAITRCVGCGIALCEEHAFTGIGPSGRKESRCYTCDRKQHLNPPVR